MLLLPCANYLAAGLSHAARPREQLVVELYALTRQLPDEARDDALPVPVFVHLPDDLHDACDHVALVGSSGGGEVRHRAVF